MPRSWPVNPDEPFMQLTENDTDDTSAAATAAAGGAAMETTLPLITSTASTSGAPPPQLRGNLEWAPPRPQIVFAVYSSPKSVHLSLIALSFN